MLRRKADSRFTPPGLGPEAPLPDLLVHGADIRRPLGLARDVPEQRLRTALTFVTTARGGGPVAKGRLDGSRFEATDVDWTHGSGPQVRGGAEDLLLAITGRTAVLDQLGGDGVAEPADLIPGSPPPGERERRPGTGMVPCPAGDLVVRSGWSAGAAQYQPLACEWLHAPQGEPKRFSM